MCDVAKWALDQAGPALCTRLSHTPSVLAMHILTLPDELLGDIAAFLSALDLVHAQQVCRRFRNVLQSHAALQYTIELHATAMVDNPACRLPPGEKLRLLREKEDAWRQLNLSNRTTLPLKHNPSGIYDLTGGVLLLGERIQREAHTGTDNVRTVPLHPLFDADSDDGKAKFWNKIDLHKQVIDVGLAIPEHDLIAIVTYTLVAPLKEIYPRPYPSLYRYTIPAQFWASVDIHLIKHSTGQPHPAAAKPIIHCENTHYLPGNCSIMLEIAGDTMCFLLNNYFPFVADPATLAVYNWKTGRLRAVSTDLCSIVDTKAYLYTGRDVSLWIQRCSTLLCSLNPTLSSFLWPPAIPWKSAASTRSPPLRHGQRGSPPIQVATTTYPQFSQPAYWNSRQWFPAHSFSA